MRSSDVLEIAVDALEELKAKDMRVLDVGKMTAVTDYMVVASGTSERHVRSMADRVVEAAKASGHPPLGLEGTESGEWVLVDLQDVVVHIMQPRIRDFYKLENLWEMGTDSTGTDAR